MIKAKRIKYCIEFQPELYVELIKEANQGNIKCLSKYLLQIIKLRHTGITKTDKELLKKLNDKVFGEGIEQKTA